MQPAILLLRSKLVELVCKSWGRREDSIPPQKVSVIRISRTFIVVGGVIFWCFNPAADSYILDRYRRKSFRFLNRQLRSEVS